jgi:hypothetical protein
VTESAPSESSAPAASKETSQGENGAQESSPPVSEVEAAWDLAVERTSKKLAAEALDNATGHRSLKNLPKEFEARAIKALNALQAEG